MRLLRALFLLFCLDGLGMIRTGLESAAGAAFGAAVAPFPDFEETISDSGVVWRAISVVMISSAGALSLFDFEMFRFAFDVASEGLEIRFLNERVDWPAEVGPLTARRVFGGIMNVGRI